MKQFLNAAVVISFLSLVAAFESPSKETTLLYQFNKRKMESFIYDMESWSYL